MDRPFTSAWLKWGRAVAHAQALEREISSFKTADNEIGSIYTVYEPRRHGFSVRVESIEPISPRWRLMVGDFATNVRSSLDHLAWDVVARGKSPALTARQERQVYFPITKTRDAFATSVATQLPGARRADLKHIRFIQPWRRGTTSAPWHCLTLLSQFVNADKHRQVQGLWMVPRIADVHISSVTDCVVRESGRGRRVFMESDTEIGFFRARKQGKNPTIELTYDLTLYPAFHPLLPLQQWLDVTTISVSHLLSNYAEMPDELEDVGLDADQFRLSLEAWRQQAELWASARGRRVPMQP